VRSRDRRKGVPGAERGGGAAEKPSECAEHDLIARFKRRHAALPLHRRLMRRLRARKKRLQSQDANIYPLW
jgi:hypothetical protein